MSDEIAEVERRFPRRFLLATSTTAIAAGAVAAVAAPAEAAPASTTWKLGGNPAVAANGSNFIGPRNAAPLIFKTKPATGPIAERMRIAPNGRIGIGVPNPVAQLHVMTALGTSVRGSSTSTASTATGVLGTSVNGSGVRGVSDHAYGVLGASGYAGMRGEGDSYGGIFVGSYGVYTSGTSYGTYSVGTTCGVLGTGATGVSGTGSTNGVAGTATGSGGNAVLGSGGQYGVRGTNGTTAGVRGESNYVGVWGQGTTYGLYGLATDTAAQSYGIFAQASNGSSFAVWSQGNCHVNGTLSKSAGSFKIDHPLDPDRQWLSHSFVESPDMMNVYNGNVVLDDAGEATVDLPDYFTALNRDYRYQLTPIGAQAAVYVAGEVADNSFRIAGGVAGLKVSWQVTGIRQDDYAKKHPIEVETAKSKADRGTRQFVAPGSSATPMRVGPARTKEALPEPGPTPLAPHIR